MRLPDGNHTGKLQIETLDYDRAGNALNWAGGIQVMSLKPDIFAAIQKSGVPAHVEIDVPSGKWAAPGNLHQLEC